MYALHMTVHIRERDGIEYLYFLAGKRQFYLGRKGRFKEHKPGYFVQGSS